MAKILIISCSPRKRGNSDRLCDAVAEGAKSKGNDVEKVRLPLYNIKPCMACDECHRNGGTCIQPDDMQIIIDKMQMSDVIVFATPLYFFNMSGLLKNFLDRTYSFYERANFKKTAFIVVGATAKESDMQVAVDGYKSYLKCLHNVKDAGILLGTSLWQKEDLNEQVILNKAFRLGTSF